MDGSISKLPYYRGQDQWNPQGPKGDFAKDDARGLGTSVPPVQQTSQLTTLPYHPILNYLGTLRNRMMGQQPKADAGHALCGNPQGAAPVGSLAPRTPGSA